ncbi:CDI toxin immunity protein [Yokenella regensburgei]|jgi:hypothetical protein|uniref:Uncharacterized protein n=1 Tax=Yokenella regensburgei TaxID=158877 RepID=A0AB38FUR2_9ENTR|nr:hypothetical protein [Yokenella regensburgei]KFD23515.1 hypothetical protein GYRE_02108 [Yokenella regensburgei ATCC 49455]SQA62741.1 Uncharacterised protein [Yokenella regensburgei]SQA96175.1 Uncharacterised protein [Yokenella regensburgei]SUQ04297.1 Uncharacterised protein [Yokenella regensburgei]
MTLFDECKEALSADFEVLEGQREKDALDILYNFPFANGNLLWADFNYSDYEDINDFISDNHNENYDVFVFVDDINIPIFRTNLVLIAENIYDVTALSPKIFIFNNELILQPLFPTEIIRLGIKN